MSRSSCIRIAACRVRIAACLALIVLASACGGDDTGGAARGAEGPAGSAPGDAAALSRIEQDAYWNYVETADHFSYDARMCAGADIVRAVGAERLDEIVATGETDETEAELIYAAFEGCVFRNVLIAAVQARVPDLRIEQSRCFNEAGPAEEESREMLLAAFRGLPAPDPSPSALATLNEAMEACFTEEQIAAVAQS